MLSDTINGTDTTWKVYTRQSATSCSYPLVPSIIVDPIMSPLTAAAWADSGKVIRDTLDTCVVDLSISSVTRIYSVDMRRGVVIGFMKYGDTTGTAEHQYFYGYTGGIYYLQRVACSTFDTTIQNGGYEFYNIRINGEQVPVINTAKRKQERFPFQWVDRNRGTLVMNGLQGPVRVALFDMRGRRISSGENEINGPFAINRLCPSGGCPSGPLLVRIEAGVIKRAFPVVLFR
jgi:hypothetical protein